MDDLRGRTLKYIETILSKGTTDSYRDYLIATLVAKNFTVETAKEISQKNMLLCTVDDMNLGIALKNHIRISEIASFNDEDNLRFVINSLSSEEPLTLINNEVKEVLTASKELVSEIQSLVKEKTIEDSNESILKLFDEKTQKHVEDLIVASFDCFRFDFAGDLIFTRKDTSTLMYEVELALSYEEANLGLSKRPFLPDRAAMWYEFTEEAQFAFATTNVVRDLSVAYIKADGTIDEMVDRKANDDTPYRNKEPAKYVLEVMKGWFEENNIHVGDHVRVKTIIAKCQ